MIKLYYYHNEELLDIEVYGVFSSYRNASEWLIDEGFEVYFDQDASELSEEYIIGFHYVDDVSEQSAIIEELTIVTSPFD